jgi:hypothetical protein
MRGTGTLFDPGAIAVQINHPAVVDAEASIAEASMLNGKGMVLSLLFPLCVLDCYP